MIGSAQKKNDINIKAQKTNYTLINTTPKNGSKGDDAPMNAHTQKKQGCAKMENEIMNIDQQNIEIQQRGHVRPARIISAKERLKAVRSDRPISGKPTSRQQAEQERDK